MGRAEATTTRRRPAPARGRVCRRVGPKSWVRVLWTPQLTALDRTSRASIRARDTSLADPRRIDQFAYRRMGGHCGTAQIDQGQTRRKGGSQASGPVWRGGRVARSGPVALRGARDRCFRFATPGPPRRRHREKHSRCRSLGVGHRRAGASPTETTPLALGRLARHAHDARRRSRAHPATHRRRAAGPRAQRDPQCDRRRDRGLRQRYELPEAPADPAQLGRRAAHRDAAVRSKRRLQGQDHHPGG